MNIINVQFQISQSVALTTSIDIICLKYRNLRRFYRIYLLLLKLLQPKKRNILFFCLISSSNMDVQANNWAMGPNHTFFSIGPNQMISFIVIWISQPRSQRNIEQQCTNWAPPGKSVERDHLPDRFSQKDNHDTLEIIIRYFLSHLKAEN